MSLSDVSIQQVCDRLSDAIRGYDDVQPLRQGRVVVTLGMSAMSTIATLLKDEMTRISENPDRVTDWGAHPHNLFDTCASVAESIVQMELAPGITLDDDQQRIISFSRTALFMDNVCKYINQINTSLSGNGVSSSVNGRSSSAGDRPTTGGFRRTTNGIGRLANRIRSISSTSTMDSVPLSYNRLRPPTLTDATSPIVHRYRELVGGDIQKANAIHYLNQFWRKIGRNMEGTYMFKPLEAGFLQVDLSPSEAPVDCDPKLRTLAYSTSEATGRGLGMFVESGLGIVVERGLEMFVERWMSSGQPEYETFRQLLALKTEFENISSDHDVLMNFELLVHTILFKGRLSDKQIKRTVYRLINQPNSDSE